MRLDAVIKDLMYDNDCVVVPGFGAFIAIHASAKLNAHSHIIYPPSRNVGFNSRIKHNDGLLAHSLVQLLGVTMQEAQVMVDNEVGVWLKQLSVDNRVAIDGLGVVFQDSTEQLQFVPDREQNYLASSFGLLPMQLIVVRPDFGVAQKVERDIDANKLRKYAVAAAVALLLGASWFMGSNYRSDIGMSSLNPFSPIIECDYTSMDKVVYPSSEANNYAYWLNAMEIPSDKKISLTENASKESDFKVEEHPLNEVSSSLSVQASETVQASSGYAVIGGAFQEMGNAKRFLEKLKSRGYQSVFAGRKGNLQLVAYGVFRTQAEAELAQQDIISNGDAAWIKELE